MIDVQQITKRYGDRTAIERVTFSVTKGEVLAFLGPNGAGKTTTIRMLATLTVPTAGEARVLGYDVVREAAEVRARVAMTGQFASLDEDLTGFENLVLLARLYGYARAAARDRATELLEAFDLVASAGKQVKAYSGGMRRRIDIAASLVAIPEILFLDEPTTGLDPRGRNQVWDLVRRIAATGTTVLLTTQYLEEADRLAARMAVIEHGKVIAEGTSRELKASVGSNALHARLASPESAARARELVTRILGDGLLPSTDPLDVTARLRNPGQAAEILAALTGGGIELAQFSVGSPSLDEVFLALTGRPSEESAP